ncbi:YraN family protein, partial [Alphaproteobacteria bacterium]|nr:YraN family protein [Alphaproteobacteria bacterium]
MKNNRLKSYRHGLWAEYLVAGYLMLKGYRIVCMRYKSPVGEVDLIARKKEYLVVVEVKFRKGAKSAGEILETIHTKNQVRVERAMAYFLAGNPQFSDCSVRFDGVAVSWPLSIRHLDN